MSKAKRKKQFYLLSLGCSKNTVDSEGMASLLGRDGYRGVSDAADASVLMVNTCGFIESARQESIDALRELVANKGNDHANKKRQEHHNRHSIKACLFHYRYCCGCAKASWLQHNTCTHDCRFTDKS